MKLILFIVILLTPVSIITACTSNGDDATPPTDTAVPQVETKIPASTLAPSATTEMPPKETETSRATVTPSVESRMALGAVMPSRAVPLPYDGPVPLEERALVSPVIARVRLDSVSSSTESGNTYQGTKYLALLEFSFSVEEYLKGGGAEDIVAVWAAAPFFNTEEEAEGALLAIVAARDTQWDNREAIVFLKQDFQEFLPSTQRANRYYLAWGGGWPTEAPDDGYSLASRRNRLWLPSAAAVGEASQATGDKQHFLTAVPPDTGTAPTITLADIKTRIASVIAKLAAGDGSDEYMECVQRTYQREAEDRYSIDTGGDGFFYRTPDQELASGLAASNIVYELIALGALPDRRDQVWLDGGDVDLFRVELEDGVPHDYSGDGTNDSIRYAQRILSARPLPAGRYLTHYNNRHVDFVPCEGYTIRHEWTVTVNAPVGTLHEAFFDPASDGTAVAADDSNGVLKPAAFTDANGASATLERIAWEPGTVKVDVNPNDALKGQLLDFIELDGSISLSLDVDDAETDEGAGTYSWSVSNQPWHDGDLLMLRIRES